MAVKAILVVGWVRRKCSILDQTFKDTLFVCFYTAR